MNSKIFFILLTTACLYLSTASAASAATITVNTLTDENNTNAAACSLREAINNANNDNTTSGLGCTAGSGTDGIVISVNGTITPTSALPTITTSMSITGNGAGLLTITGGNVRRIFNINGGTVSINNLTAANGFDASQGGAINNGGTAVTTVAGVVVTNSRSNQGGGLENDSTMTVNNSVISNNQGTGFGGGIVNYGTLTVTGSTFSGNQSNGDSGGIANNASADLTVADSTFTANSAATGGSAILHTGSSMSVTRSAFSGNLLSGAVTAQSVASISNSTFSNNAVSAVEVYAALNLTNCTISGNRNDGGAITLSGGSATLVNNIVAGNTNAAGTAHSDIQIFSGSVNTAGSFNNLIGTGGAGGLTNGANGNQTGVPLASIRLLPLGNYGGAVQTMPIVTNSPARNAGRNTGAPAVDARGYSRPQGGTVDIGAFEVQTNSVVVNTNNSGTGSLRDTVAAVPANEIVQFETPLFYNSTQTISLSGGQIAIAQNMTIYGAGANLLTVRNTAAASNTSRVFNVADALTVTFYGISITGGNTTAGGGGISTNNGTVTVNDCYIYGNLTGADGGGIRNGSGTLTVNNTTISNNVANSGGGVLNAVGGGIDSSGTLILNNVTVSGNSVLGSGSDNGGGVYTTSATITNSTIANNTAPAGANASGLIRAGGVVTIRNSIVAANVNNESIPDVSGAFTSNGFNLIGNRGTATGFTQPTDQTGSSPLFENPDEKNLAPAAVLSPALLPLASNGGTVPTHALNGNSLAIDKGNSFGATTDARGLSRPVDLTGYSNATGGNGTDIGAYEAQLAPTAAGVSVSGRVLTQGGAGLVNATVYLTDSQGVFRSFKTSSFGNYVFENVRVGETYTIVVVSKKYQFDAQILSVGDSVTDLNFIAFE